MPGGKTPPAAAPRTSVLVATRNGTATIGKLLDALCALVPPPGGWEAVIVDNASTDGTAALVASYCDRLPLTLLTEARPGKNRALNQGLGQVAGDLVAFTDDDVIPQPDWLVAMREAADAQPGFTVIGGLILPCWETQPPAWILETVPLGVTYALLPDEPEGPGDPKMFWGPNVAIRRAVFDAGLRFDETIGPDGTPDYAMGSETEMNLRLAALGHRFWRTRAAVVRHIVKARAFEREWLIARAHRAGRGAQRLGRTPYQRGEGSSLQLLVDVTSWRWRRLVAAVCRDKPAVFTAAWKLSWLKGVAVELRRGG
ncbi:MAG TPA: glycosyltransferase [Stellaceae bacterium]